MEAGMKAHSGEIKLISNHVSSGNGKCGYMERELYADGELVYKDRMSDTMFCFIAEHPDLLMALRLFCVGECRLDIGDHTACGRKKRNHLVQLFQFIRLQLKTQKLNFGIKLFKLRQKYKFLRFKSSP